MSVELRVPEVGESVTEVQVGEWLKGVGDSVARDEPLVTLETDKVTVELPAPVSGTLREVLVPKGKTAAVGALIGLMDEGAPTDGADPGSGRDAAEKPEPGPSRSVPEPSEEAIRSPDAASARVMPAARRALHDYGLSSAEVAATGPGGRLLKEDVERHAQRRQPPAASEGRQEEVVPMSVFRRRIAERLVQAQQQSALLTTFNEVDMSAVIELRAQHQARFVDRFGVKLGFMSFFVKAAVEALKAFPAVNAEVRGDDIVYRNYFDIGVAIGGGRGLVVPVIRNAERLGFAEVEQAIVDFSRRAKENSLELHELQGGTFTISNGGIYGSLLSTPIVNPPQSGILGLHAIQERPVVREGSIVVRPMMYVALTYDHRIVDGREAVTFLYRIKECIEQPARILLEV